jgi:hypothetical protein
MLKLNLHQGHSGDSMIVLRWHRAGAIKEKKMCRPRPIPTASRSLGVAAWLVILFTAATVAALVLDNLFHWSMR